MCLYFPVSGIQVAILPKMEAINNSHVLFILWSLVGATSVRLFSFSLFSLLLSFIIQSIQQAFNTFTKVCVLWAKKQNKTKETGSEFSLEICVIENLWIKDIQR